VSKGSRTIEFARAGTITLREDVTIEGSFVTIDGTSAPAPGITLRGAGLRVSDGVHDVVIRGIRIRDPKFDGIGVKYGAHDVLIENVSVDGAGDGNIDITKDAHDVTVAWSVLSDCKKNMLVSYQANRVTLHHNVFIDSQWRNPWIKTLDDGRMAADTTADMRNNIVWAWGNAGGGTGVVCGAKANVVNNYYSSPKTAKERQEQALIVQEECPKGRHGGLAYTYGNVSADHLSFDLNDAGNRNAPFPAPVVDTHDACIGARDTLAGAGAEPLDETDRGHLSRVTLSECGDAPPPEPEPEPRPRPDPKPDDRPEETRLLVLQVPGGKLDAEEKPDGDLSVDNETLRIGEGHPVVAFQFPDVTLPPGARILSARLRFYVVDGSGKVSLRYVGERAPDSRPLRDRKRNLSHRARTRAEVTTRPRAWKTKSWVASPDLSKVVQEIVRGAGWRRGNDLALFVENGGSESTREVAAHEMASSKAATLEVRWKHR
jgi:hypothetical protein